MVEWRKLGEITKRNKGIPITAGQMSELNTPSGDVRVFAAGQTIADINEENLPKNCVHKLPSIIVKSRGYIDFEFYEKPFTHKNEMWSYSFNDKLEGKYIYYFLTTQTKSFRKKAKANSVKLPQLCVADTDNYLIPVPSLSVQKRIVDVLDTFTSSIENLKEQIALRRKLYEYYRDQLLDLEGKEGVEMKTLDSCLDYEQPTAYLVESTEYDDSYSTPVLTAGQSLLLGYTDETDGIYRASKESPCIIFDDFTTSFHWIDYDFKVKSSAMKMLRPKGGVNFRYVYYTMECIRFVPGGHQRHWISKYSHFEVPIPSLQEQQRIVSILDTFEASIQNLEAQLSQRKKQYEYYRNKLLKFE